MIRVVGIDASTSCIGVALTDGTCRSIRPTAPDTARRLHELTARLATRLHAQQPDLVVIEDYNSGARKVGTTRVVPITTIIALAELGGCIRLTLFELAIPYVAINASTLKHFATGHGRSDKEAMLQAARDAGAEVANHDEADAWWLRIAGRQRYQPTLELPQLTRTLTQLPWPELHPQVA